MIAAHCGVSKRIVAKPAGGATVALQEMDQFFHTWIMRDDKQRVDSIRSVLYMLYWCLEGQ